MISCAGKHLFEHRAWFNLSRAQVGKLQAKNITTDPIIIPGIKLSSFIV